MNENIWLPQIDPQLCTACGDCVLNCPTDALSLVDGLAVVSDPAACNYCAVCETVCPEGAISLPYQLVIEQSGQTI